MILAIIFSVVITAVSLAVLVSKKSAASVKETGDSANDFINVLDIKEDIICTKEGLISVLKIQPIYVDLLSKTEEKMLIQGITSDLSKINDSFKLLCISRPIDIAPLLEAFQDELSVSTNIRRELLRAEINEMTEYALSGTIVERQFFMLFEEPYKKDTKQRLQERIAKAISNSENLTLELLTQKELIKFCNLIYNPASVNLEDTNIEENVPVLLY